MKLAIEAMRRLSGLAVPLLLLSAQQALAAGTLAGTTVENLAEVNYQVGGVDQEVIESSPTGNSTPGAGLGVTTDFVVDNRVDFTLVESGDLGHATVTPGELDEFLQFQLTNTGNATQDFLLTALNLALGSDVDGNIDTDQMANIEVLVDDGDDVLDAGDVDNWVDELAPDAQITIFVRADATPAVDFLAGDVANIELQAVAASAADPGNPGTAVTEDNGPDVIDAVQIVFGDAGEDNLESAQDGYIVSSASLTVTKESLLIADPFNGGTNPKHIPGAVVQYTITVANAGTEAATNVVLTDPLTDVLPIGNVTTDNGAADSCTVSDADADFCGFTGGTLTIGPSASLDVPAGGQLTVTFQVEIQ
ncbi:MAG: DUF11 domain-containing protein [Gammaproteobacteria bacterium]|nr:DUF11 domain-containing protein [Gammaproteobacteria bacterium]MDH4252962.1 DUF11 domain-containing protein [Gammaproteobacteria bacterium]MDH5308352.1 DUF11 domain-containing protein [Gammaproteobacteria bacterium]